MPQRWTNGLNLGSTWKDQSKWNGWWNLDINFEIDEKTFVRA